MAAAIPVATAPPATADKAEHREEDSWLAPNKVHRAAQAVIRYDYHSLQYPLLATNSI